MPFPNVGGTERATLRLAEAAAHCGFENTIYCPRGACDLKHFYHEHAFSTAVYDQIEPSYHHPLPYLRAAQALAQDMKRRHVRIVHCADILGAHYAALAGRLAGAFVLSHVRCQHSSITRRDQTFLYPLQKFVFVSKNTWEVFGMNVPKDKGEVLYDGISETEPAEQSITEIRARYGLPGDVPVIGMASRVHPCKDFGGAHHKPIVSRVPLSDCGGLPAKSHAPRALRASAANAARSRAGGSFSICRI
jgi:glycosyltransferase involved in cell wall biosynthesis